MPELPPTPVPATSAPSPYTGLPRVSSRWFSTRTLIASIALGAVYGLIFRLSFTFHFAPSGSIAYLGNPAAIMTEAFLLLGPAVIGFLTVRRACANGPVPIVQWIVLPWAAVVVTFLGAAISLLEGSICLIFALPLALLGGTLGGIIGGLSARFRRRLSRGTTASLALLPFLLAPAESLLPAPIQTRTVRNTIRIHAPAQLVWRNIERVPAIAPTELRPNWTHRIGFPRPVEATLSFEGVGGVRHASFERGLLFLETVTAWQPEQRLAFSIQRRHRTHPAHHPRRARHHRRSLLRRPRRRVRPRDPSPTATPSSTSPATSACPPTSTATPASGPTPS